jgi:LPS export ABC transporter protein LptC
MIRKPSFRNILALVILLLAGALTVTVVRNFRSDMPEKAIEALPRNVDFSLRELSYDETRDGMKRWRLLADRASHSLGEGVATVENVRMTFYDESGAEDLTLTARRGTFKVEAREIDVEGDVVLASPRGYTLYTDRLSYREAERMISTDAPIRLVSTRGELNARGLRLSVQARTLELLSQVRARLAPAPRG